MGHKPTLAASTFLNLIGKSSLVQMLLCATEP
jgi:hypothetical protein